MGIFDTPENTDPGLVDLARNFDLGNRVKLIIGQNPYMANQPGAVMQMASDRSIGTQQLAENASTLFGAMTTDSMAANLSNMNPASQRSVFSRMGQAQQQALTQSGYKAPTAQQDQGVVSDVFGALGGAVNVVTGGISKAWDLSPGGELLHGLSVVMDQPAHLYRTLRTMDNGDAWLTALGIAGGLAFGFATGGVGFLAEAGSLAALGAIGTSALAGAGAANALVHPMDLARAWQNTSDGEHTYDRESQKRADELLGDSRLQSMARVFANSDYDMRKMARDLAQHAEGDVNAMTDEITKIASKLAIPQTEQYKQVYTNLLDLAKDEVFQDAVQKLQNGKISFGRDIADTVLDSDSSFYGLVSGSLDAAWVISMDPTLLLGHASKAYRARSMALDFSKDVADVKTRIVNLAQGTKGFYGTDAVKNKWTKLAAAVEAGDAAELYRIAPDFEAGFNELLAGRARLIADRKIMTAKQLAEHVNEVSGTIGTTVEKFGIDELVQVLVDQQDMSAFMRGLGTVKGNGMIMTLTGTGKLSEGAQVIRGNIAAATRGATSVKFEERYARVVLGLTGDEARGDKALFAVWNTLKDTPDGRKLLDEYATALTPGGDYLVTKTGEFIKPWMINEPYPTAAAVGRAMTGSSWTKGVGPRVIGTVGQVLTSMTTMVPAHMAIDLTDSQAVRNFTNISNQVGMSPWVARMWRQAIMDADDLGTKQILAGSFMHNALTLAGITELPSGEKILAEAVAKSRQTYGFGNFGVQTENGIDVSRGVLLQDVSDHMVMPNLTELRKAINAHQLSQYFGGSAIKGGSTYVADVGQTFVNKYWKPAVLLRPGFILRAGGEEMLNYIVRANVGSIVQEFGARSIAQGKVWNEASALKKAGRELTVDQVRVMATHGRVPAHLRGLSRTLDMLHWERPANGLLDRYASWTRHMLENGVSGANSVEERLIAQARRTLPSSAYAKFGERLTRSAAVEQLQFIREQLLLGSEHSWRRMVKGGVHMDLVNAAEAWESRFFTTIMREASASGNAAPASLNDSPIFKFSEDKGGAMRDVQFHNLRGQFRWYEKDNGLDSFYKNGVYMQANRIFDHPETGQIVAKHLVQVMPETVSEDLLYKLLKAWEDTLKPTLYGSSTMTKAVVSEFLSHDRPELASFQWLAQELSDKSPTLALLLRGETSPSFEAVQTWVDHALEANKTDDLLKLQRDLAYAKTNLIDPLRELGKSNVGDRRAVSAFIHHADHTKMPAQALLDHPATERQFANMEKFVTDEIAQKTMAQAQLDAEFKIQERLYQDAAAASANTFNVTVLDEEQHLTEIEAGRAEHTQASSRLDNVINEKRALIGSSSYDPATQAELDALENLANDLGPYGRHNLNELHAQHGNTIESTKEEIGQAQLKFNKQVNPTRDETLAFDEMQAQRQAKIDRLLGDREAIERRLQALNGYEPNIALDSQGVMQGFTQPLFTDAAQQEQRVADLIAQRDELIRAHLKDLGPAQEYNKSYSFDTVRQAKIDTEAALATDQRRLAQFGYDYNAATTDEARAIVQQMQNSVKERIAAHEADLPKYQAGINRLNSGLPLNSETLGIDLAAKQGLPSALSDAEVRAQIHAHDVEIAQIRANFGMETRPKAEHIQHVHDRIIELRLAQDERQAEELIALEDAIKTAQNEVVLAKADLAAKQATRAGTIDNATAQLNEAYAEIRLSKARAHELDLRIDKHNRTIEANTPSNRMHTRRAYLQRARIYRNFDEIAPAIQADVRSLLSNAHMQTEISKSAHAAGEAVEQGGAFSPREVRVYTIPQGEGKRQWTDLVAATPQADQGVLLRNKDLVEEYLSTLQNQPYLQTVFADEQLARVLMAAESKLSGVAYQADALHGVILPNEILTGRVTNGVEPLGARELGNTRKVRAWKAKPDVLEPTRGPLNGGLSERLDRKAEMIMGTIRTNLTSGTQQSFLPRFMNVSDEPSLLDRAVQRFPSQQKEVTGAASVQNQEALRNKYYTPDSFPEGKFPVVHHLEDGKMVPLPADKPIFKSDGGVQDFLGPDGKPITFGDPMYFDPHTVEGGTGNVMWSLAGPSIEDLILESQGVNRYIPKAQFTYNVGELTLDDELIRANRSRVSQVSEVPETELPNMAPFLDMTVAKEPSSWVKTTRFGFDKVIGPALDAMVRKPMAFHFFQQRYTQNMKAIDWLVSPELRKGIATIASTSFHEVPKAEVEALSKGLRKLVYESNPASHAQQMTNQELFAWARGHNDLGASIKRVQLQAEVDFTAAQKTMRTSKRGTVEYDEAIKAQQRAVARRNDLASLDDLQPLVDSGALQNMVVADMSHPEILAYIRSRLPEGAAGKVSKGSDFVLQHIAMDPVLNKLTEQQWKVLDAAENNWKHINQAAGDYAAEAAIADMMPFIDSHELRTQFADHGKGFLPFWYAEENFLKRWARTVLLDPVSIHKAQLGYMGLKNAGIVRTDPTGRDWFVYPGSGLISNVLGRIGGLVGFEDVAKGIGGMLQSPTDTMLPGVNAHFGTPQFSPLVGIPLEVVSLLTPDVTPLKRAISGDYNSGKNALAQFVPSQVYNLFESILSDTNAPGRYASAQLAAISHLEGTANALSDDADPGQVDEYLRKVASHARIIAFSQAIAGFFTPGPPGTIGDGNASWLGGDIKDPRQILSKLYADLVTELGIEQGTIKYLELYPMASLENVIDDKTAMGYTVGQTTSKSGAPLPATAGALAFYDNNSSYLAAFPDAGPWLLPQDPTGQDEHSQYAYDQQTVNGMRVRRTPREFLEAMKFKEGSGLYFSYQTQYLKNLDALKLANDRVGASELTQQWTAWATMYKATHPIFRDQLESSDGRARRRNVLDQMRLIVNDPSAPQADHFTGLKDLMGTFDQYQTKLATLSTNQSTRSVIERELVKKKWGEMLDDVSIKNPALQPFIVSIIRPESSF